MKVRKLISICLAVAALAGCSSKKPEQSLEKPPEALPAGSFQQAPEEYSLFYESGAYSLGLYEPAEGCYIGGYVLSNKSINFEMDEMDSKAGKKHAVSIYTLKAGNPFPDTWVLSCIAQRRTPLIAIKPQNSYNPYNKALISELAEKFGEFYVPIFVEFFPEPLSYGSDSEAYVEFFRYAREEFRNKASNAAFVWSVDASGVADSERFYPGDQWVDWVGLRSYERIENGSYASDTLKALDSIYYAYQRFKPIMISQLAVSFYTSRDHVYRTQMAADELKRIYGAVADSYPRVKLIAYMDVDEMAVNKTQPITDNFTVTSNVKVSAAYGEAISNPHFLESTDSASFGEERLQVLKSPFPAYRIGESIYASELSFLYDLSAKGLANPKTIEGETFYDLNYFAKKLKRNVEVDENLKKVLVESPAEG
ncbi:MAG: glycoside hydrolase family 26 protein [Clostridiales bacterium]|jgi:hypothetical protein|nr:glycoside hydrolase family 26 protein [Clostridiales bacterium]